MMEGDEWLEGEWKGEKFLGIADFYDIIQGKYHMKNNQSKETPIWGDGTLTGWCRWNFQGGAI
jgi:hypothetical protein